MASSQGPIDIPEDVAALLGVRAAKGVTPATLGLDALRNRTRKELLDIAKKLELARVSKLSKESLAERVLEALKARVPKETPRAAPKAETVARTTRGATPPARPRGPAPAAAGAGGEAAGRTPKKGAGAILSAPPDPGRPTGDMEPASTAKLDLGPAAQGEKPVEHIPWSYGMDRITAAAVDPDTLHVYWEVTDPAIERARAGLGPGGPDAWLNLRVYDTSGLIFDGTNAHSYFDHRIERSDRQWFFTVGKPSSTAFVEIGMKSAEGFFVKIARASRVEFPRKEPAPWSEPEWMTVVASTGEVQDAGRGAPVRETAGAPAPEGPTPPFMQLPFWSLRESANGHEYRIRELLHGGWERVEWYEISGEGWFELEGRVEWQGPLTVTTWEAGPFAYPVQIEPPQRQEWQGRSFAYKVGDVTHVVYGPWQVVIRNLGAHQERAVLGRWEVYRSWVAESGRETRITGLPASAPRTGASELLGGSERVWLGASELRLGGASEVWRIGASELRFRGASERLFVGASQWLLRGASERRLMGASEIRLGGASERFLGGASERALGGASERALGGASERLGASELRLGGSEQRFEGGSAAPLPHQPATGAYPAVE